MGAETVTEMDKIKAGIKDAGKTMKDGAYKMVGKETEEPDQPLNDTLREASQATQEMIDEVCPSLTWKQRLIGFAICAGCGYLVSFGSFIRMGNCINGDCVGFALGYTFGGIIALCATFFLMGPC